MRPIQALLAAAILWAGVAPARAETDKLRVGLQYGLVYMQLVILRDQDFIGARARAAGMPDLKAEFLTTSGPTVINDALVSGALDVGAVGLSNLVTLWDKTRTNLHIRGLAGMNVMPLLLVSRDPRLRSVADYGPGDRIAVPSVKVSMQAMMLDLLAARAFGEADSRKLDPNTVSMGHPDATAGLLSGGAGFSSHFSSLPYQHTELAQPGMHVIASSFDAIGPHSVSALAATTRFVTDNPKVVAVFLLAMQDATDMINQHRRAAAEAYLRVTKDKIPVDDLVAMMGDPGVSFTLEPKGAEKTADFMFRSGVIKQKPAIWKDMYFDTVPGGAGS